MSLKLLLDENMSQTVAAQVQQQRQAVVAESVHLWHDGAYEGRADKALLQAARAEGLTLVTYDQKTIPPLLAALYADGEHHAGIVFVDQRTISSSHFGALVRALLFLWDEQGRDDWQDRIGFLRKPIS